MKRLVQYLKKTGTMLMAAATICGVFASCDRVIYDEEGDCSVNYHLVFRYDLNMKWADAFAHEVSSVRLYAFDEKGVLAWQKNEKGPALNVEGYTMNLDVPAGKYSLLAWCGLDNDAAEESFTVPAAEVGRTRIEDMCCTMARSHESDGSAYSDKKLYPLFHGQLDVNLPTDEDGGDYYYTMYLTKNTNHVRVILQHISGAPVDVDDFNFRIDEENGLMASDNSVLKDENINYREWQKFTGTTSAETKAEVSVAVADLTVARLLADRSTYLTITATDGHKVAKIPLVDFALLLKANYYEGISDQEYLDREDEYSLVMFLDEHNKWISTNIFINSWRLVFNNIEE